MLVSSFFSEMIAVCFKNKEKTRKKLENVTMSILMPKSKMIPLKFLSHVYYTVC